MNTIGKTISLVCVLALSLGEVSSAEELGPPDLSMRVRSIFLAKCSECHGRGLSRPKAALYLHELGPLAANPEWVVPHEPDKSYLWTLIRDDDMPAKGAKAGLLNAQEKEVVRAWIAAGAPVPPSSGNPPVSPSSSSLPQESGDTFTPAPAPVPPSLTTRLLAWFGKFHILVIHFPIALLVAAALGEMVAAIKGVWIPEPAVRFCVLLGASSALSSVALGWLHADVGGHGIASLLGIHRWLGTTAGLLAVGIAVISERDSRRRQRSGLFRVLLWSGTFLVAATAHFGGLMVHGNDFFDL
jgi:mono/diheme cytochrome c family protein